MKAFKVHNAEKVKQEVNLPAGTYTYSFRVIPVGTSYTFRLDNQSFTFEGLTAGILNKRMKHTFELTEAVSFFYLSNTIGDCVFEPQIEEGVFATTPGAHPLDFERLISEAGIEIDHEALSLYAKKADVSAEIKITADRIDSTVGNISNDVDGVKGDMTTISQTVNSITSTVTNHTTQISTFQQTVDQIYASIEDVGSGEFTYILQRIDEIEMKVGAPGQSGSIHVALDSIASTVYDENTGMSAINQKVGSITATITNHTSQISTFQQTVDQIYLAIEDVGSGEFSAILQRLDLIELSVGNISGDFSTLAQTVNGFEARVQTAEGNLSTLTQTVDGFEARVQTAEGNLSTLSQTVNGISAIVSDVDVGLSALSITVGNISTTVYNQHGTLLSQISQDGSNVLIQASKIKLEGLVTANQNFKILADGSIEAKNGKFTGTITATSGTIGGFKINASSIGTGSSWNGNANGMSLWKDFIVFNDSGRRALIGATSDLGFEFLGLFSDTSESALHKTGVIFNVRGSIGYNTAISLNAGHISGLAVRSRRVSTSVILNQADVYISCYNSSVITIHLPSMPEEGKIVIIKRMNSASITFNGNGKIIEWGIGQGSSKAAVGGVGDTHVFIWDGQYWNYNYMGRQPS